MSRRRKWPIPFELLPFNHVHQRATYLGIERGYRKWTCATCGNTFLLAIEGDRDHDEPIALDTRRRRPPSQRHAQRSRWRLTERGVVFVALIGIVVVVVVWRLLGLGFSDPSLPPCTRTTSSQEVCNR